MQNISTTFLQWVSEEEFLHLAGMIIFSEGVL